MSLARREVEAKRAEWKAGQTARTARNVLGQARRAAESASKRVKADMSARRAAGLGTAMQDIFIAQMLDLAQEAADIGRELAACSSDIPRAVGAGWKARRKARRAARRTTATGLASCCRSKGSATSTRADDLRTRLRALLSYKRSKRARVGRRPAVLRRPTFSWRQTALAREFFKPTAAPCSEDRQCEKLQDLLAQLNLMSASELAAKLSTVDGSHDTACATERVEGEACAAHLCSFLCAAHTLREYTQ